MKMCVCITELFLSQIRQTKSIHLHISESLQKEVNCVNSVTAMTENRVAFHLHLRQSFSYLDKYLNKTPRSHSLKEKMKN